MPSLFLVVNVDWFLLTHRLPIALEAKKKGYDVTIVAIDSGYSDQITKHGFKFIPIPMSRSGLNIFVELKTILFFIQLYKKHKPDIIHQVAMKPVIYGSIASKFVKVGKVVNALPGLGFALSDSSNFLLRKTMKQLFKFAFSNGNMRFIFQNHDDYNEVVGLNIVDKKNVFIIKGSGVDLHEFAFTREPVQEKVMFFLPARILADKGIIEFIEASKIVEEKFPNQSSFIIAGRIDLENKAGISESYFKELLQNSPVIWVGEQSNIYEWLCNSNVVVLPSYREGIPKSLIEACAVGRAIITTNVPGCKEVVTNNYNGLIVEKKQIKELAAAMEFLLIHEKIRNEMGEHGRKIAEAEFSIQSVLDKTFEIYNN